MMKSAKYITILLITLSFFSCKDNITNEYYNEPPKSGAPDVNIISSEYSCEVVHTSLMDTSLSPSYSYGINLNLVLDKPENRTQINKIIIVNEAGFGWDFFKKDLESFYVDSIKGYSLKHLVPVYTSSSYSSTLYKIRMFSETNIAANEYQFIMNSNFLSPYSISHGWLGQNSYSISFSYYSAINGKGYVAWLNSKKEIISKENYTIAGSSGSLIKLNNVPSNAYYFYYYYETTSNNIKSSIMSEKYIIEKRLPENIQILEFSGNPNYSNSYYFYLPQIDKFLLSDPNSYRLYLYDCGTLNLENSVDLSYQPRAVDYSDYDQKIYIATQDGKLYSANLSGGGLELERTLGQSFYAMKVIGKYIILSIDYQNIKVYNIETGSLKSYALNSGVNITQFVYNESKKIMYGLSYYSSVLRFKVLTDGSLSDIIEKYSGYNISSPALLSSDGTKLISSSGYIFNCSDSSEIDLSYYKSLGSSFQSAQFMNDNSALITFNANTSTNYGLSIFSANTFSLQNNFISFYASPRYFYISGNTIKVISVYNNKYIVEDFNYSDLLSNTSIISKALKEKFYAAKKIEL